MNKFKPNLPFIVCYYFGFHYQAKVSLLWPFAIGLLIDAYFSFPLGVNALTLGLASHFAMKIPKQSKRTAYKNEVVGLIVLVGFVETLNLIGFAITERAVALPAVVELLYSCSATIVVWFLVAFLLNLWIAREEANLSF